MSIYVGDKKAKIYRGDYGPAQLYKGDVKIAGYTDAEKVGAQISGVDTYNDALNLTIEGRSEQTVAVLGKNLFSKPNAQNFYPTAESWFHLKRGRYVVSVKQPPVQAWRFVFFIRKDGIAPDDTQLPTHLIMYAPASTTATGYSSLDMGHRSYIWGSNQVWTYQTIELDDDYDVSFHCYNVQEFENVQFEVAKEIIQLPTTYEPFVPNSPSPDYPSPIRSSENFDVVSCGRNLVNIQDTTIVVTNDYYEDSATGFTLHPNTRYTLSFDYVINSTSGELFAGIGCGSTFYAKDIVGGVLYPNQTAGRTVATFNSGDIGFDKKLFVRFVRAGIRVTASVDISDIQLEEGTTATPYQPYHAITAHITDPLRSVGDVSDSIEVSEGKAEVVRRVANTKVTSSDAIGTYGTALGDGLYGFIVTRKDILPLWALSQSYRSVCTHSLQVRGSIVSTDPLDGIYVRGDLNSIFFKVRKHLLAGSSVLDFKKFLDEQSTVGTPVVVQYPLATPTRTDITATPLGQALLSMRTYPHYTQVYTNATLPPTLRAKIKEMEQ